MASFRVSLPALLIGLTFSQAALPIGFGELQVQSRLNQPLQAEIPVLGVSANGIDAVKVRLGGREEFAALGLDYSREIDALATELVVRNDQVVLQLRSRDALREPLLNLVLVAEEGSARMLRDYAVLLDLPDVTPTPVVSQQPVSPLPSEASASSLSAPPATTTAVGAEPDAAPASIDSQSTSASLRYGPTRTGDSLSILAHRLGKARGDEWHAFGVALYLANPDAFIAGDPNRLKAAMALQLPTSETVARYSRRDWNALFAGTLTQAPTSTGNRSVPTAAVAVPEAPAAVANQAQSPAPNAPLPRDQDALVLADLRRENGQLRAELSATAARMQELEQRLAELDARQQSLAAAVPAASAATEASASSTTLAEASVPPTDADISVAVLPPPPSPVAVEIRDQIAAEPAPAVIGAVDRNRDSDRPAASEAKALSGATAIGSIWSTVLLPLLLLLGLTAVGALFWFWYERRHRRQSRRPVIRSVREPRPVLPLVQAEERHVDLADAGSPDRRALKMKQIQAALDTYVSYQRLDRAIELLEQESQHAGDDLVLRRHLQKILKDIRRQHQQWQEKQQQHLMQQFDTATSTHSERGSTRDDSLKSSG